MDNGIEYIIGIVFASVAMFVVWFGYRVLVPIYSTVAQPIANQYPSLVHDNPTYVMAFNSLLTQLNIGLQASFFVMALGIGAVFIIVFAYRRQGTSASAGEETF